MADRSLVLDFDSATISLGELLDRQVEALRAAHRGGRAAAAAVLRATGTRGSDEEMLGAPLTLEAARVAIARDHGYADWLEARADADLVVDTRFEAAADAIQWGELTALRDLLDADPRLISMRSPFPHRAMLLHHVAANGIEVERQLQSPPNATEVTRLLLERGAEPDAPCDTYGGGINMTTLCLLVSSCWPAAAGVQAPLVQVLCRGGAKADGPADDSAPLWTALTWGYTGAAEELVRCGARVDNLVCHAALGDLAAVRSYFGADGTLAPAFAGKPLPLGGRGACLRPEYLVEYALILAAEHDRGEVVSFLLGKDPDLRVAEPFFGATARGAAAYFGHAGVAAMIEQRL
jgi:hypothetical protein